MLTTEHKPESSFLDVEESVPEPGDLITPSDEGKSGR